MTEPEVWSIREQTCSILSCRDCGEELTLDGEIVGHFDSAKEAIEISGYSDWKDGLCSECYQKIPFEEDK